MVDSEIAKRKWYLFYSILFTLVSAIVLGIVYSSINPDENKVNQINQLMTNISSKNITYQNSLTEYSELKQNLSDVELNYTNTKNTFDSLVKNTDNSNENKQLMNQLTSLENDNTKLRADIKDLERQLR